MIRYIRIILFSALLFSVIPSFSAERKDTVQFAYDVNFDMNFDNREFSRSRFSPAMTIFGSRLSPSLGFSVKQTAGLSHKVMLGADLMKDFGSQEDSIGLMKEMTMYYLLQKKTEKNHFTLQAGIFPRTSMEGYYSDAFFSDSLKFYDNNIEGLLLKLRRKNAYFEAGCDWMGQYSKYHRERLMIFTAGSGKILPFLSLGYSAYMYHFANSETVKGLVDNFLFNPYVKADFGSLVGLDELSVRAGWIEVLQNDRMNIGHYIFSGGAEIALEARHRDIGIRNTIFAGRTLMPLYNKYDRSGNKYGNILYFGDPFYRLNDDDADMGGIYDKLEIFYEPYVGGCLKVQACAVFHFTHVKYAGCQQVVRLVFDLQQLLANRQK